MEQTLAIVKPNLVKRKLLGRILTIIEEDGFDIKDARLKQLTQNEAEGFYAEHKQRPFFTSLVKFMTSGPVFLMVLETPSAVEKWRNLMGATDPAKAAPHTIRRLYGESIEANGVHGSDSQISAEREIRFFFGS
ncbi:MAG: nucleoside-diphosphate kinase [Deltaproteobacteria bacterium]|nr:nucleoside-diphosphate kinase [Deltaproteobacteria bacterium]